MNRTFFLKPNKILIGGAFLSLSLTIYFFGFPNEPHPTFYIWPTLAIFQFYFSGLFQKRKGIIISSDQISLLDYHQWKRKRLFLQDIKAINEEENSFVILLKSGKEIDIEKKDYERKMLPQIAEALSAIN